MEFELLWWHWMLLGIILCIGELALPSFVLLLFGIAAIETSVLSLIMPDATKIQIGFFIVNCIVNTLVFFKIITPRIGDKGTQKDLRSLDFSESGLVISQAKTGEGQIRFVTPVHGKDVWQFYCEKQLKPGERVTPTRIEDNRMIIDIEEEK